MQVDKLKDGSSKSCCSNYLDLLKNSWLKRWEKTDKKSIIVYLITDIIFRANTRYVKNHTSFDFLGCLESVLPRLKFVDITESDLEIYKSSNEAVNKERSEAQILIADNPYIGSLIYSKNLPFKFIQVWIDHRKN